MSQTMINIRMDTELKKEVEKVCSDMGLSMTAVFTLFAKKLSRERRIPFEIVGEMSEEQVFQKFMEGINGFTDDCFANGREPEIPTERDEI